MAIGTAAAISIGALGYAIYSAQQPVPQILQQSPSEVDIMRNARESSENSGRLTKSESRDSFSSSPERETDVYELMEEILVEALDNISLYAKIAGQVAEERPEEREDFAAEIRQQSNFSLSAVHRVLNRAERVVCKRHGVSLQTYYEVVKHREDLGDR